jgi:hypothetical protein
VAAALIVGIALAARKVRGGLDMRFVFASVLAVHGIAHLVGFASTWRLIKNADVPYKTTILSGTVDLGDAGIRLMGIGWFLLALAFLAGAVGAATRAAWAPNFVIGVVLCSLLWSAAAWPEARIGVYLNLALLIALRLIPGLSSFLWQAAR